MAYELLANADLSKMQEKQALLAGLGVGKGLLDNAQGNGLHSELKNLGLKNKNVNYYAEQVDSIASQVGIDLDQINLSWIRRFLPATAVIVGMRYNSRLIEEVIGVARATFAPDAKLANRAITDDTSSEAEVKKDASNEQDDTAKDTAKDSATDKKAESVKSDKSDNKNKASEDDANKDKPKQDKSAADSAAKSKDDKAADKTATESEREKQPEDVKK